MIEIITGAGTHPDANPVVPVAYWAVFPRAPDGHCAFCLGDPCNEDSAPDSVIAKYYAQAPRAHTCPVCDGRPT